MLRPGSLSSADQWLEAESLARSIEEAMVAAEIIDLDEEGEEATLTRRKTFIALATGIIDHLKAAMEIHLQAGDLRGSGETGGRLPGAAKSFTVVGSELTLGAGSVRPAADSPIPRTAKTLSGKVR